jgi:hypothetical protein
MADVGVAAGVSGSANLSYCSIVGDLDRDGDQDLLLNNYGGPVRLLMNQEAASRRSFRLRIAGEGRVRDAIGASATVRARLAKGKLGAPQWREVLAGGNGYLGQSETTLHFGFGSATTVGSIVVQWPAGGASRTLSNLPTNLGTNQVWTAYPPSRLGDVDGGGAVNLADWTQFAGWGPGALVPGREMLDFDGDGDLDGADAAAFWSVASFARGDLDASGAIDAADLSVMLASWAQSGSIADLDLDGTVGASDLALLLAAWGS